MKTRSPKPNPKTEESSLAEASFRTMFESLPIGIIILDIQNLTLRYNKVARSLLDDPELPDTLTDLNEFIHVRYREAEREKFTELVNGQRDSYTTERCYHRSGGETFWSHVTISAAKDDLGEIRYIVGMMENITEQRADQQKLIDSEERFRTMFDTAAVGIGVMSLDRKLMDANPALCQMFKVPYEDLIGQTPAVVTYPEDYAESTRQFADLISGKMDTFRGERRYIRKNGEVFWAHVTMSLVRDKYSKPLYLIGMLMDIDDQKQALAELQESEARFRAMFDNVSVGMAMMSLERQVLALNHTAEKIVGYQADELRGMDAALLSHPEDRAIGLEQFQKMVAGQSDGFRMEKRYLRKTGDVFWARITYSLVHSPDGKPQYLIGLIEDTTEQKLTAEKLADQEAEYLLTLEQRVEERTHELSESNLRLVNEIEQRQRAEESLANKAVEEAITAERTRLARDLHDAVTQTLFSASIIAEVLPELWQVDEAEAKNSTEELRQLTRGALAEMRTLLFELRPATLTQARFPDLLKQLSEAVIGRARLPVTLNVSGDYELPPDVKVAFYRIAQESLNNIVKYSRATQVEIRVQLDCCNVHLTIKDNGIGFDTSAVKTTSLGMRIMRERAENIGARLTISSTPGQGTEVSVVWNEDEIIPISQILLRGEM